MDAEAFAAALAASIRIPEAVGATAVAMLALCDGMVEKVNGFLISDLAVCADLAMATVRCASYNVRTNLPDVNDPAERKRLAGEVERVVKHGVTLVQRIAPAHRSANGAIGVSGDPRDYKLDISSLPAEEPEPKSVAREFVGVQFRCCGVYQRIYKSADGARYEGRCPRCMRPVRFIVGAGGTEERMFVVE